MNISRQNRAGFTLVELLVVITIIGILIAMLLPSLGAMHESARNVQCKNNLKQMGTACLAHEQAHEMFPTGGWGWFWVGDPDRGYGVQQPGGWIYNILPFTESTAVHDLGRTAAGAAIDPTAKRQAILQMVQTTLPFTNCPTRRRTMLFPESWQGTIAYNSGGVNSPGLKVARSDYAICNGDVANDQDSGGPAVGADSLSASGSQALTTYFGPLPARQASNFNKYDGVCFELSTIRKDDITDGLSQTLLLGEKYLIPNCYLNGQDPGDNENQYVGFDNDIFRTTHAPPMQDRAGYSSQFVFGSAHPFACNFVLCDGAVITISYAVDPENFRRLGTRCETPAAPVDMSKL